MPLRPKQARWFELYVPRDQTIHALQVLADSGTIELEEDVSRGEPCANSVRLHNKLAEFDQLRRRFAENLPSEEGGSLCLLEHPEALADTAVQFLHQWSIELLELKRRLKGLKGEHENLALLAECLTAMGDDSAGLDAFSQPAGFLYKGLYACPRGTEPVSASGDAYLHRYPGQWHDFWILAGALDARGRLDENAGGHHCVIVKIPAWLEKEPSDQRRQLQERLTESEKELEATHRSLANHRESPKLREALADMHVLRWYLDIALHPSGDHHNCHVTGWTTVEDPADLRRALAEAHVDALVIFPHPRHYQHPPVSLSASRWTRPFQLFVRLFGTPDRSDIDPTALLAVVVPLLFGFMFPDLGHGLILALAGVLLSRRNPDAAILISCGLAAAGFGLVFGEVFGLRDLFPAPCGCPLENPLTILGVSLLIGVGLLLLGLALSGIESYWRGEGQAWMREGAPVLILYLSAALSIVTPYSLVVSAAALAWYMAGIAVVCRGHGLGCVGSRLGHLVESIFQLAVNTFSFLRVGAFAIAHVAFSAVVFELVQVADSPLTQAIVFVIGHLMIIVIEGLVVLVQTTRLILFEFFIRFLRVDGRIYRPLPAPDKTHTH